jgi:hypothetical protein
MLYNKHLPCKREVSVKLPELNTLYFEYQSPLSLRFETNLPLVISNVYNYPSVVNTVSLSSLIL